MVIKYPWCPQNIPNGQNYIHFCQAM
jgi:hypothetical protein